MARKTKNRQIYTTYLILVEGSTELIYFQNLKETYKHFGFTVKLQKAKHGNPAPLIEEAMQEYKKGVYRNIWCVYDCDVLLRDKTERFNIAYKTASKQGIRFAESMPCIEVWFILHFEKPQNIYQNADAVIADLRQFRSATGKEDFQRPSSSCSLRALTSLMASFRFFGAIRPL
jgi:hypothetical protein